MPKVATIQSNFTAGELSPRLMGRVDIAKYFNGAETMLNFILSPFGDARSRPGTYFVKEVKDSSKTTRLIPFMYSTEQAYQLEFGDGYIRFYKDQGAVTEDEKAITGATQANPCVISCTAHGYSNGDQIYIENVAGMTQLNGKFYTVANKATDSFELSGVNSTGFGAYTSGGEVSRVYEIASPYHESQVMALQFAQEADVMYIVHPLNKPRKLSRTAHTAWTLDDVDFTDGPYLPENVTNVTIQPGAATGITTLTAACPAWAGSTDYIIGDFVTNAGSTYKCILPHTSTSTFSNDLAAGKWRLEDLDVFHVKTELVNGAFETWPTTSSLTGWTQTGTSSTLAKEASTIKEGTYSAKLTRSGYDASLYQDFHAKKGITYWQGRTVTFGCWVYSATASVARIKIDDGVNTVAHAYHAGDSAWAWQSVTMTVDAAATRLRVIVEVNGTNASCYFDGASCLEGASALSTAGTIVGGLFSVNDGWVRITGVTSKTVVTCDVAIPLGGTSAYTKWAEGAWNDYNGWPSCVGFYEQRLFYASNTAKPQTAWGSYTQEYDNFQIGEEDDEAVLYTLASGQVNKIRWIETGKVLGLGTSGGVFNMSGGSSADPLTPSNVLVKLETSYGVKEVPPKTIGNFIYYIQRNGRQLREFKYSFSEDSYVATDMTLLSDHILKTGAVDMDYQQSPDNVLWIVRADGTLVSLTRQIDQDVSGWARHKIAGSFGTGDAIVESVSVIPNDDEGHDEVWLIVKRTIDGQTRRYIEFITPILDFELVDEDEAFFVDSGLTYDGAATTTITGLDHLEGETVTVLADGATHPTKVVSGGSITLDRSASVVHVGLGYNSDIKTVRVEAGAAAGTAQSKVKRVFEASVRLHKTGAVKIGKSFSDADLDEIQFRTPEMPMDAPPPLFSGDKQLHFNQGWNREGQVHIRRSLPLPCTILAVILKLETND